MRGFVFTTDALFAAIVSITIAISFYLLLESVQPLSAQGHSERELLAGMDKLGTLETMTDAQLASVLSPYNKCGTLTLKTNGVITREVISCACSSEEKYVATRSFVKISNDNAEHGIATLKTCLK